MILMREIDVGTVLICVTLIGYAVLAIKDEGKSAVFRIVIFLAIVAAMLMAFNAGWRAWEGGTW
jgi:hypothetical protein